MPTLRSMGRAGIALQPVSWAWAEIAVLHDGRVVPGVSSRYRQREQVDANREAAGLVDGMGQDDARALESWINQIGGKVKW